MSKKSIRPSNIDESNAQVADVTWILRYQATCLKMYKVELRLELLEQFKHV
jgi:hypothetical protein